MNLSQKVVKVAAILKEHFPKLTDGQAINLAYKIVQEIINE